MTFPYTSIFIPEVCIIGLIFLKTLIITVIRIPNVCTIWNCWGLITLPLTRFFVPVVLVLGSGWLLTKVCADILVPVVRTKRCVASWLDTWPSTSTLFPWIGRNWLLRLYTRPLAFSFIPCVCVILLACFDASVLTRGLVPCVGVLGHFRWLVANTLARTLINY